LFHLATQVNVLVIADEVKWGYRRSSGATIQRIGLCADIYVYSKAIGNGWPIANVVGAQALLAHSECHVSTLTFEAAILEATDACLTILAEEPIYESIAGEGA